MPDVFTVFLNKDDDDDDDDDDRKSGQAKGRVSRPLLFSPARIPLIVDPTRPPPAFSIRQAGTG